MSWWEAMLFGMLGGAVWRVTWNATKYAIVSTLDRRLDHKREALTQQALHDPQAVADRLGLPRSAIERFADGMRAMENNEGRTPK